MTLNGLWHDHVATPRQRKIVFSKTKRNGRRTQADVLLAMLRQTRANNKAVELPDIMHVGIAQHGARLNEIRSRGFIVENELDRDKTGVVRSRYWLRFDPERDGANEK
jgi:hypothetical protein